SPIPPDFNRDATAARGFRWALETWIDEPLLFTPGTRAAYTTFGFNLAGAVIEDALGGGRSFAGLIDERIAQPFGMTGLQPDYWGEEIPSRAVGYVASASRDKVRRDADVDVSWKLPGGGFVSTPEDIARYCEGLLAPDVVSDAAKA